MIRRLIPNFIRRVSDFVLPGRNAAMIIIGTDRKDKVNSGYGDHGKEIPESATIDLVAGYKTSDIDHKNDASRIYISERTNPDEYFGIAAGPEQVATPAIVSISDQVYIKARKNIKIVNENFSIVVTENGDVEIKTTGNGKIGCGDSVIVMNNNGEITLGSATGPAKRILTEDDVCSGVVAAGPGGAGAPASGAIVSCSFKSIVPPGSIGNNKIKIRQG